MLETSLGVLLPKAYVKFLNECGSCNFGDTYINGVYKEDGTLSYPVVELTKQLREELNVPDDFIVLNYEIDEYLILYKVSKTDRLNDSKVYGAEIHCNKNNDFVMSKPTLLFNSFDEYFEDFLELAD
ncbi:SMI1/KNR4 family protein [Capnocytophaga sputigena]|uniref:SMI1/KNR4 family protein n=1 Tax=Capnocytophaga sputigena TaxID=1019 RepID=UPI0028F12142|nr:SMI1/KNR4 family protein [Capnocytophaga sputigena]